MISKNRKKQMNDRRKVAGYVRVSTQRQNVEGDSLEAQKNAIKRNLDYQFGSTCEVVFYVEGGKSAKNQNRPELQKLRAYIANGEVNTVICTKLDRITRSILDFAELWEFFNEHEVEFISINERVESSTAMGRAMLAIIMVFAQLEREVTGERTKATMMDRASRGLSNGGCKYGYVSDPNERGKLIPDPEWAEIMKVNFFDALERLGSAGAVQRELAQKSKIMVPKRPTRSGRYIGGKPFTKQQVVRILRNPIYVGQINWGDVIQENCHEPIVSREQFERVQAILDQTTKHHANRHKSRGRGYSLRGLVRCGCGAMMTPKSANGRSRKHHYYECTRKSHQGPTECNAPGIPAESLEEAVIARVSAIGTSDETKTQIIREALKLVDSNAHKAEQESDNVRKRLTTVKAELGKLLAVLKEKGTDVWKSIQDEMTRLESEQQDLESKLEELRYQQTPLDQVTAVARKFIENWDGLGELLQQATGDERRVLLEQFVEVIQLIPTHDDPKKGIYALRLFPEAVQVRTAKNGKVQPETQGSGDDPVLIGSPPVRQVGEKAPRAVRHSHRGFVELGSFAVSRLRRAPIYTLFAWNAPPSPREKRSDPTKPGPDPLRLARYYQSLLDTGKFESRAALARFLGVSRARVTQVLNRLREIPVNDSTAVAADPYSSAG